MRRRPSGAGRRGSGRRPGRIFRSRRKRGPRPSAGDARTRRDGRPPAGRLGQRGRRHGAADLRRARLGDRRPHRRGRARLLRRHRADRPPILDRHGRRLDAVALRQGRAERGRRGGLRQLPDEPRPVRGLRRRGARGGENRVPRVRGHALFRRLPADRGDGRARPRDPAARADEARRAHQRPPADRQALRRRPAPPGQRAGLPLQHRRLPDQAEIRRAEPDLPDDPGPRARRIRPAGRHAPQHLPQFAEAARPAPSAEGRAAAALRRPDHRLRGLCRERRGRPDRRALRSRRAARARDGAAAGDDRDRRAPQPHHRRPYRGDRRAARVRSSR